MDKSRFRNAARVWREQGLKGVARNVVDRARGVESDDGYWSNYLQWLIFAVPGGLARGNIWCMDYAIQRLPSDAPIVEIGSSCGLSANAMTYLKGRHGKRQRLITCDPWTFEGGPEVGDMLGDSKTVKSADYREFMKASFVRNTRFFSSEDLPYTVECTSDAFFEAWRAGETREDVFGREVQLGGSTSFCYIDGNHTYDFARRDFENCDATLEPGGFLLFDDSEEGSDWGSLLVAREVAKSDRYELVAQNPNYFFRKK